MHAYVYIGTFAYVNVYIYTYIYIYRCILSTGLVEQADLYVFHRSTLAFALSFLPRPPAQGAVALWGEVWRKCWRAPSVARRNAPVDKVRSEACHGISQGMIVYIYIYSRRYRKEARARRLLIHIRPPSE